jgi:hypothetical protein
MDWHADGVIIPLHRIKREDSTGQSPWHLLPDVCASHAQVEIHLNRKGTVMPIRLLSIIVLVLSTFITATATNTGFTTLNVNGEAVQVYRDDFGIPHIFAETNRGLFEAYGYTVAQDRLWQLELNRRAARGRLAEIFGPSTVPRELLVTPMRSSMHSSVR